MKATLLLAFLPVLAAPLAGQRNFPRVPVPAGNPITAAKAQLGKALFHEEQLSSTGTVACATCHLPEDGGSDPRASGIGSVNPGRDGRFNTRDDIRGSRGVPGHEADGSYRATTSFSIGEQVTNRRGMTVINAAFARNLFWDGRADNTFRDPVTNAVVLSDDAALESQAVGPIVNTVEMSHFGQTWTNVVSRLSSMKPLALATDVPAALATFLGNRGYPQLFQQAFGSPGITPARIAMAIATYERTLISDRNRVDDFLRGNRNALTQEEQRGRQIFTGRQAACTGCHGGPLQTDNRFHYTGVTPQNDDIGREVVTNNPGDRGRMRTPTMRNVGLRAPYFHDGSARNLEEVVAFYNRGGNFNARNKDRRIRRLNLSQADQRALVAFLRAFTDPRVAAKQAPFDRPTLYSESSRVPEHFGAGTAGSQGIVPRMVALEPAAVGQRSATIGIDRAFGGSAAILLLDGSGATAGREVAGVRVHVGLSPALTILPPVALRGVGAGNGWGSFVLGMPNEPALRGTDLYLQWISHDTGRGAFAATDAVKLSIF